MTNKAWTREQIERQLRETDDYVLADMMEQALSQLAERDAEIERLKGNAEHIFAHNESDAGEVLHVNKDGVYLICPLYDDRTKSCLDGNFTAAELRAIATRMEEPKP